MEHNRFKQRLVGGVILVSLAIIVLPMIIGEKNSQGIDGSNIPAAPERAVKTEIIPLEIKKIPDREDMVRRHVVDEASPEPVEPPTVAQAVIPEEPKAVEKPAPEAIKKTAEQSKPAPVAARIDQEKSKRAVVGWVVQVGSFSSEANALALRDKLRKQKFPAFVEALASDEGKPIYRVRVGPELDTDRAQALRQKLSEKAKIDGIVMHHR
jgi:DedD protein